VPFLCVRGDVFHLTVAGRDGYSWYCVQSDVFHLTVAVEMDTMLTGLDSYPS
jgi:hypothetical protein